ncbi:MAG: hypothetical protein IPK76_18800 [Lewinellaceae bacterium]|nr:hypothetical protein [Lewinellaceae bacterium]
MLHLISEVNNEKCFCCIFFLYSVFLIAQCTVEDYKILLQEAKVAQKLGKYDLAFNKLLSAQICQSNNPEKVIEVKNRILEVFQEVNIQRTLAIQSAIEAKRQKMIAESQRDTSQIERNNAIRFAEEARRQRDSANIERNNAIAQRKIAEENAREFYANDLAYKSQAALENGNLSVAFRLADFAKRFIHQDNPNINRALTEALYFNDHPEDIHRLPWHYILSENYSEVTCVAYS